MIIVTFLTKRYFNINIFSEQTLPQLNSAAPTIDCVRFQQGQQFYKFEDLSDLWIVIDYFMIKDKYTVVQTIKNLEYKQLQRCKKDDGTTYILKSYSQNENTLFQNEIQTYQKLKQPHLHGFPEIKEAFQENQRAYLVIEELGDNVDTLRIRCGGRLGLKTVLMVGLQILERIEYLHKSDILHGDIKPSNFLVGRGKMKHKIYLSDFQLSSLYIKNGKHITEDLRERFSGSLRFSSRAANSKNTIGRKDELESFLYSLIFLLKGELPWMNLTAKNIKEAIQQVLDIKNKSRAELLSGLPETFRQLMSYIDQLKFGSTPDYGRIRGLLQGLMKKNGYELDYKFDWQFI